MLHTTCYTAFPQPLVHRQSCQDGGLVLPCLPLLELWNLRKQDQGGITSPSIGQGAHNFHMGVNSRSK